MSRMLGVMGVRLEMGICVTNGDSSNDTDQKDVYEQENL
jgi:hypothetical protein